MKIVSIHEAARRPYIHPVFTGPYVTRKEHAPDNKEVKGNMVNSGNGARNKFHAHDSEQMLIVVTGEGIVATENEEHIVTQGDVIFIPPGVPHWRGASTHVEFSHIFVSPSDSLGDERED
ncbi:MAG: cupin domain-containing protein [Deltaproteobacteria bacterium]|nr:cupin domain-containing protein [Deltaproteobacteria bacterium]